MPLVMMTKDLWSASVLSMVGCIPPIKYSQYTYGSTDQGIFLHNSVNEMSHLFDTHYQALELAVSTWLILSDHEI